MPTRRAAEAIDSAIDRKGWYWQMRKILIRSWAARLVSGILLVAVLLPGDVAHIHQFTVG